MKTTTKLLHKIIMVLVAIAVIFLLQSCFLVKDKERVSDKEELIDELFFDWSNLNYSEAESYTIFDDIDLNLVAFDTHKINADTVIFDIYLNGEKQKSLYPGFRNKFDTYRAIQKGVYTVKITAKKAGSGTVINEQFDLEVKTNNRANNIKFVIRDSNGVAVDKVRGGGEYTFVAEIYADDILVNTDSCSCFWEKLDNAGKLEHKQSFGNIASAKEISYNFHCFIINNSDNAIDIMSYVEDKTFILEDNLAKTSDFPEGIYYSYGVEVINGKAELFLNVAESEKNEYFYNRVIAWYQFDNGDIQELGLTQTSEENKVSLMISYDEQNYSIYSQRLYDYSYDRHGGRILNYFANGVKYQFDPTQSHAKIHLAIWQKVKRDSLTYIEAKTINSSKVDVTIVSTPFEDMTINTVSGKHKEDSKLYSKTYKSFTKSITNNTFEVYVCCDMNGNGSVLDEYFNKSLEHIQQYFVLDVLIPSGSLWDYTVTYSYTHIRPIELKTYVRPLSNTLEQYFVCPSLGEATIHIKSRFGEAEKTLTVKVIDKVFYNDTKIETDSLKDYGVYSNLDVRHNIRFQEYYLSSYSKNNFVIRKIKDEEQLEYLINNTVIDPVALDYSNNGLRGQDITVRIKGTNISAILHHIYIIPTFAFALNNNYFATSIAADQSFYHSTLYSKADYETSKAIHGEIPIIEYIKNKDEAINFYSFEFVLQYEHNQLESSLVHGDEIPRYKLFFHDNVFTVSYLFYYTTTGFNQVTHIYEIDILKVNIIESK
jgi:hypothetical protein